MFTGIIPVKTPEGQDELARRTRRLSQRHRTVLLLVDGHRSVDEVLALAHRAGVAETFYRELLDLGLIQIPEDATAAMTVPVPFDAAEPATEPMAGPLGLHAAPHVDLALPTQPGALDPASASAPSPATAVVRATLVPLSTARELGSDPRFLETSAPPPTSEFEATLPSPQAAPVYEPTPERPPHGSHESSTSGADSLLPSVRSLLPDSTLSGFGDSASIGLDGPVHDRPLEEARAILIRAVRAEAPVAGSFTLIKLKRASSRADLEALLDEVESRIAKPRKLIVAAQTLRHVRHLLGMPAHTAFLISK